MTTNSSTIDALIENAESNKSLRRGAGLVDEDKENARAERKAKKAAKEQELAEKRATKRAKREQKNSDKKPAHIHKLDKAKAKLSSLGSLQETVDNLVASCDTQEVAIIVQHLQFHLRNTATLGSLKGSTLNAGDTVKVIGGDAKYIGKVGTIEKTKRIHAYVIIEGVKRPVYAFVSDLELVEAALNA